MAKITRFSGNLKAFGADAVSGERSVFGEDTFTPSDSLTDNINSAFLRGWGFLQAGRRPPREWFNSLHWVATQLSAYSHQTGVPEWHASQEFYAGSVTNYGGRLWQIPDTFVGSSVGNEPPAAPWQPVGASDYNFLKSLASAPRVEGRTIRTLGFYEDSSLGGQLWKWDSTQSKTNHDGITVLDPDRADEWDGTHADLNTLFTAAGSGTGCFISVYALPTLEREVGPYAAGASGGGVLDDYIPLQQAVDVCLNKKYALHDGNGGIYRLVAGGLVFNATGMGHSQGLVFTGKGTQETKIVNDIEGGAPSLDLTAGSTFADFIFGAKISKIGFSGGVNAAAHGIQYRGCWGLEISNCRFDATAGSAIRPINVAGDADSSVSVTIDTIFAFNCGGPAFDSNGSTGGLTLHTLKNVFSQGCGGSDANIVIDGMIHVDIINTSVVQFSSDAGFDASQYGIHLKASNVQPRGVEIDGGEFGNNLQKAIYVDSVSGLKLKRFRLVRRTGQTNFTTGVEFADGVNIHTGVIIDPLVIDIDTATPVFTLFKIGTGVFENFVLNSPAITAFAAGNVYVDYAAGVAGKGVYIEDRFGRSLTSQSEAVNSVTVSATGTTDLEAGQGSIHRVVLSGAGAQGAHTVNLPDGADGQTLTLILFNATGGAVSVTTAGSAGITGYTDPANGAAAVCEFVFDALSAVWRQKGGWS